ncbi:hypothetical protein HNV12_00405 [Methanococcoides sp. SA1]|nr:hypothetical protein [Methanococcoides sp. SA1]
MAEVKRRKVEGEKAVVVVESGEEIMTRRVALVLSVVSFVGSLVFWSQGITGNVVAGFTRESVSWIGGVLFVLAVIGMLVYVQKRKK